MPLRSHDAVWHDFLNLSSKCKFGDLENLLQLHTVMWLVILKLISAALLQPASVSLVSECKHLKITQ